VSNEIRRAWHVPIRVVPMSDQRLSTLVTIDDGHGGDSEISFQDYFVRLRHNVAVKSIRFDGAAQLAEPARRAVAEAGCVVIAPSNPLVSIGPIRSLDGVDALLASRRDEVVAISPIVGGAALKGPADRMLLELGLEASVVAVAHLYAPIASTLVIDTIDAHHAAAIESTGMRCVVTDTVMSTPDIARRLAEVTLASIAPPR